MILAQVIARLKAAAIAPVDTLNAVAELGDQPAVRARVLYVIPDSETASEGSSTSSFFEEIVQVGFAVVAVVSTAAARETPGNDLEAMKEGVKAQLLGWKHPSSERPTLYRGAQLLGVAGGQMSMLLRFVVTQRVRTTI